MEDRQMKDDRGGCRERDDRGNRSRGWQSQVGWGDSWNSGGGWEARSGGWEARVGGWETQVGRGDSWKSSSASWEDPEWYDGDVYIGPGSDRWCGKPEASREEIVRRNLETIVENRRDREFSAFIRGLEDSMKEQAGTAACSKGQLVVAVTKDPAVAGNPQVQVVPLAPVQEQPAEEAKEEALAAQAARDSRWQLAVTAGSWQVPLAAVPETPAVAAQGEAAAVADASAVAATEHPAVAGSCTVGGGSSTNTWDWEGKDAQSSNMPPRMDEVQEEPVRGAPGLEPPGPPPAGGLPLAIPDPPSRPSLDGEVPLRIPDPPPRPKAKPFKAAPPAPPKAQAQAKAKVQSLPKPAVVGAEVRGQLRHMREAAQGGPYALDFFQALPVTQHWQWHNSVLKFYRKQCWSKTCAR